VRPQTLAVCNFDPSKTKIMSRSTRIFIYIIFFCLFEPPTSFSQNIINGKIIDSSTKEALIGTYIIDVNSKNQSITNESGEFSIKTSSFPSKIMISFLGYERIEVVVRNSEYIIIPINPIVFQLPEVTVSSNVAVEILQKVVDKALSDTLNRSYHKVYYQKTSSFNGKYSKLYEMFLNVSWGQLGVNEWQPTNSRFAFLESTGHNTSNFISFCFLNSATVQPVTIFPINKIDISEKYNYKLLYYLNQNTINEVAVIECKPKANTENMWFQGIISVNTTKNNLLQIKGKYDYSVQKSGLAKEQFVDINFGETEKGNAIIKHVYFVDKSSRKREKNIEKAWLYFYEDIPALSKAAKYPSFIMDENEIFDKSEYNESEWNRNIPIKYTIGEQEAIKYLGKNKKYFGNFKK
jgi:CarboxypepD_reg-like domain